MTTTSIISAPTHCNCGEPGTLNQIIVIENRTGKPKMGSFSEFCYTDGKDLLMQSGYRFKKWHVTCPECFYEPKQKDLRI